MILPPGVVQSIDKNRIEIGECWLTSSIPVWSLGYGQELAQPISVSAAGLGDLRFTGPKATIEIREEPDASSRVVWAGVAKLVEDPTSGGGGGTPSIQHADLLGRSALDSHPITAITGLADALAGLATVATREIEAFPRGDIIWQMDPGGLWDSGLCFVQMFPVLGRTRLSWIDFEFGAPGSGADGGWALWGGEDASGSWTLLDQGLLPNTAHGIQRLVLGSELNIEGFNLIALAQDPGASGVMQPVRQSATYFSPAPPSGPPAVYAYLGTHVHANPFTTLPVIPAADATFLMQKWTAIGVR